MLRFPKEAANAYSHYTVYPNVYTHTHINTHTHTFINVSEVQATCCMAGY